MTAKDQLLDELIRQGVEPVSKYDQARMMEIANALKDGYGDQDGFNLLMKYIEERHPDLWAACYPRAYQGAGQYGSPKGGAAAMVSAIEWMRTKHIDDVPISARVVYTAACVGRPYGFPTFFVAPELLAAVRRTSPPPKTRWQEMKLPYESGLLVLPNGAFLHPTGVSITTIGWCRLRTAEVCQFGPGEAVITNIGTDSFSTWSFQPGVDFALFDSNLSADTSPHVDDWNGPARHVDDREGLFDMPLAEDEEEFLHQMRGICFGVLLAIQARPQLVSHGSRIKQKNRPKSGRELWSPNVIGKDYRIVRERQDHGGTHASPRMHWRRGHFHHVRYGEGRQEVKLMWFEPSLVGQPKGDDK